MSQQTTIALWGEKASKARDASIEFHVNLWHFSKNTRSNFIEIGALADDPNNLSCIKIFLPFQLKKTDVQDLGSKFISIDVAQGIFNQPLSCTLHDHGKCVELREDEATYCKVHIFSPDGGGIDADELIFKKFADGALLTITRRALKSLSDQPPATKRGYFRLRIHFSGEFSPFVTTIKPADRAWNSGFDIVEYIDCRINEARTLPMSIESAFRESRFGIARTKLIAFLVVAPIVSSVTSSHAEWHKSRLLEQRIWSRYTPEKIEEGMVVYHWKKAFQDAKEGRFDSFSAFVKLQTRKSDAMILGVYLFLAFLLGVLGSLTASFFQYLIA